MHKSIVFKYSKNTLVLDDKGNEDKTVKPLPNDKKRIFDDIFEEFKRRKCKTRWAPKSEYKESSNYFKGLKGSKISHTFQIEDRCAEIAAELEDKLENYGYSFDTGTGFGWIDWELDFITVNEPKASTDPLSRKSIYRSVVKKFMTDYSKLR